MDGNGTPPDFAAQLAIGAGAGALGALAREMQRTDREFTWALAPKIISGLAIGTLGWSAAAAFGIANEFGRYAVAFSVGMAGQAFIMDLIRAWLRARVGCRKE